MKTRTYRESWVAGMHDAPLMIETVAESNLAGVRFRPGGAAPFLRSSPGELTSQVVECGGPGAGYDAAA